MVLRQENRLNSPILSSSPPRCWLGGRQEVGHPGGRIGISFPTTQKCLWQGRWDLGSILNAPCKVLVLWGM